MEAFTYSNLFETKGAEYIIIIIFLFLLIPFWVIFNRPNQVVSQIQHTVSGLTAKMLRIPQGLFFSKNHTWAYLEKNGNAKVGIDDFLNRITGTAAIVLLKLPGETVKKGEVLAELEQEGKRLKIFSPVSGKIVGQNSLLHETKTNNPFDPYDEGWIFSIRPTYWKSEISGFYHAEEATKWMSRELERFKDFLNITLSRHSKEAPLLVFQEGGELQMNPLSGLQPEIWEDFQKEFLE